MDAFRAASERYMKDFRAAQPDVPPPVPRLAIVLIGQGIANNSYPLFRKLRREGVYFRQVNSSGGLESIRKLLESRAASHPAPYGHWFIDGGDTSMSRPDVALVSYLKLAAVRTRLTTKMANAFESRMSSEALRTMLAEITPEDLGLKSGGNDEVLDRFKVSLFTEGSGTQIYSTTFVQWTRARSAAKSQTPHGRCALYSAPATGPHERVAQRNFAGHDRSGWLADRCGYGRLVHLDRTSAAHWRRPVMLRRLV